MQTKVKTYMSNIKILREEEYAALNMEFAVGKGKEVVGFDEYYQRALTEYNRGNALCLIAHTYDPNKSTAGRPRHRVFILDMVKFSPSIKSQIPVIEVQRYHRVQRFSVTEKYFDRTNTELYEMGSINPEEFLEMAAQDRKEQSLAVAV